MKMDISNTTFQQDFIGMKKQTGLYDTLVDGAQAK